jgi:nitrogen regulatory protein PII-like uncharacterized protein
MAGAKSRKFITTKKILVTLNVLALIGLAGFGGYFFKKYQDSKNASPEKIQQAQIDQTISEVGKLYSLPANEKPDVATVKDKEALKKQYPFFDQAENDDVVLIYKEAKLAILYRPSTKKLIKVGPVNIENGLSIRTVGGEDERAAVEKLLTDNKLTFTSGGDAKTDITGIIVVDLKGTNSEQAKKLAEIVKGTVGKLPAGEDKPGDADLLILVGPAR